MTVNTATSTASYTGNGTTQVFPVPFYFLVDTDIKVSKKLAATGETTVLTLNSDYTLSGAGNNLGGTLTMLVAPANFDQVYVERNVSAVQQTAYPENNKFPSASHEKALDRLTMLCQQFLAKLSFGLFRDPLGNTYDLGTNTLVNSGTAVADTDVPNLQQVRSAIVGGAAPILVGPSGSSTVGFIQAGTGATARTVQDKLRDIICVKDFGAKGDGVTDDTAAIILAAAAIPNSGAALYFPAGDYLVSGPAITVSNRSLRVYGDGETASRIIQSAAANVITYASTNAGNVATGSTKKNLLSVESIGIYKTTVNGGTAISASWLSGTDNTTYFSCKNLIINYINATFLQGIYLLNCNGSRGLNVTIKGNPSDNANTTSTDPFTMTSCIFFDGDTVAGKIDHFWAHVSGGEVSTFFKVNGWYEGFYISNFEIVHASTAFGINGFATTLNPNFYANNIHCDIRVSAITAVNCSGIHLTQFDAYMGGSTTGYQGNIINLQNCPKSSVTASKIESNAAQPTNGINIVSCSFVTVCGVRVSGGNQSGLVWNNVTNSTVGACTFQNCATGIFVAGTNSGNLIGSDNNFQSCATPVNSAVAGTRVLSRNLTYATSAVINFPTSLTQQSFSVAIPAGTFSAKPTVGIATEGDGANYFVCSYNLTASTATTAVFNVMKRDASAFNGGFRFSVFTSE